MFQDPYLLIMSSETQELMHTKKSDKFPIYIKYSISVLEVYFHYRSLFLSTTRVGMWYYGHCTGEQTELIEIQQEFAQHQNDRNRESCTPNTR